MGAPQPLERRRGSRPRAEASTVTDDVLPGRLSRALTGPTTHQNQAPFPGTFSAGVDEKVPGLIVLLSTTTVGAKNAQNLAGLFNLTGLTNQKTNEIWDTWIVGAPSFGKNVRSVLRVAIAADKNKDGIYNDAPTVVPDSNHDGRITSVDLEAYGVASNIAVVPFEISD